MNAIDLPATPSRMARPVRTARRTHSVSSVARIAAGVAWIVLTVAASIFMLDATFGYSGDGPAVSPPVMTPRVDVGPAIEVAVNHHRRPEPAPAPMLEA